MKIALIGNGAMGQLVAAESKAAGDEVGTTITSSDKTLTPDQVADKIRGHDVAIDFSVGEAVLRNIEACARVRVPLVEGTTGWKAHEATARQIVTEHSAAPASVESPMDSARNFSIASMRFFSSSR